MYELPSTDEKLLEIDVDYAKETLTQLAEINLSSI